MHINDSGQQAEFENETKKHSCNIKWVNFQGAARNQRNIYRKLENLSQNMAPSIHKFWKKEAQLQQPGVCFRFIISKLYLNFAEATEVYKGQG